MINIDNESSDGYSDKKKKNKLLEQMGILQDYLKKMANLQEEFASAISLAVPSILGTVNKLGKGSEIQALKEQIGAFQKDLGKLSLKLEDRIAHAQEHIFRDERGLVSYMESRTEENRQRSGAVKDAKNYLETGQKPKDPNNPTFISALEAFEERKKRSLENQNK